MTKPFSIAYTFVGDVKLLDFHGGTGQKKMALLAMCMQCTMFNIKTADLYLVFSHSVLFDRLIMWKGWYRENVYTGGE